MTTISLSHASWLQPFNLYFCHRGIDLTPYYEQAKINPEITTQEDGWLTKQQLYRFINLVAEGEHMPELGFLVGATITPDTMDSLKTELAQADTLNEALHKFCRMINRHVENNYTWLEDGDDGEIWFLNQTSNPFPADRRIADHAGLMTMINVVRLMAGPDWFPGKVRFQTEKTAAIHKVEGFNNTAVTFQALETGLAFPSIWLYRHVLDWKENSANDTVDQLLLNNDEKLSRKLLRLLTPLVGTGGLAPSLELLAHICEMNSRTLQRRLREEDTTFAALLEQVRMKKADTLLKTDLSIKEIAWELGYSGSNNFIRAFRRNTGMTPSAYRQKQRT